MSARNDESSSIQRSLNKQVVLEEEEYTAALSDIIARDFFPSLVHLDATNEYLDALQTQDPHLINASVRRIEEISATPGPLPRRRTALETPYGYTSQTPTRSELGEPPPKRPKYDTDMTLDNFQARYTSEDNSSFTEILEEENRVRKDKWSWAWDAQKRVEYQRDNMVEGRERMLIEPAPLVGVREKLSIEAPKPLGLITEGDGASVPEAGSSQAVVATNKDSLKDEVADVLAPKKDTRPAGVDGWKFKARNSLMFPPDADASPYHTTLTASDDQGNPRVVKYANTRLQEQDHSNSNPQSVSAPPSPTRSRIDAAITGTPYHPSSSKEREFSLVPNLPSPTPAELGAKAVKQLMTWGTLHSTPRIISQTDDPTGLRTPFHIPAITSREALSHKLSNNAAKSLRAKAEILGGGSSRTPQTARLTGPVRKGNMAPPGWTPRRSEAAGSLTPAGRRLLERTAMGVAATRRAEAMERGTGWDGSAKGKERDLNRVRWTPTPGSSRT